MTILAGDCVEQMRELPESSVDAIVTDPPYNLSFMAKAWDIQHDHEPWSREALRVLKPGGHLLAFGGTRTYHRLACAVEDAGFEIRDSLIWLYGSGFPKSLDVSKAIDKASGATPIDLGESPNWRESKRDREKDGSMEVRGENAGRLTAPATPEAQKWNGWGTALKPAHEPIVVARKPLSGTVAQNVTDHGTGALNIDGCRIRMSDEDRKRIDNMGGFGKIEGHVENDVYGKYGPSPSAAHVAGRWPANVALSPEAAAELDEQSGEIPTRRIESDCRVEEGKGWSRSLENRGPRGYTDSGGASRFFYVAKASRAERNAGLDGFEEGQLADANKWTDVDVDYRKGNGEVTARPRANVHPTVKPIDLMRWLVRLVTPPGGTVLDPFTGSGTTGIAAVLEGFEFIGCEREAEYVAIAEARIAFWAKHEGRDTAEVLTANSASEKLKREHDDRGQLGLIA